MKNVCEVPYSYATVPLKTAYISSTVPPRGSDHSETIHMDEHRVEGYLRLN